MSRNKKNAFSKSNLLGKASRESYRPTLSSKVLHKAIRLHSSEDAIKTKNKAQIDLINLKQRSRRKIQIHKKRKEIVIDPIRSRIFRKEFLKFKADLSSRLGARGVSYASSLFRAGVDEIEDFDERKHIQGVQEEALIHGHDPDMILEFIEKRIEQLQDYLIDPTTYPAPLG